MACRVGTLNVGSGFPLVLIAGPCVIESEALTLYVASELKKICSDLEMPLIFKSSFDKANRTSINSFRGLGLETGLNILEQVKTDLGLQVTSDIHLPNEAVPAAKVLDLIQIPAFLCRQTDLLLAAGATQKAVNIKKGQFMGAADMVYAVEKVQSTGNKNIMVTERGNSFGYKDVVVDFRNLLQLKEVNCPVIFDATHSAQETKHVSSLAKAAVAVGVDALFLEVHPDPDKALSDGKSSLPLSDVFGLIKKLQQIARAAGNVS